MPRFGLSITNLSADSRAVMLAWVSMYKEDRSKRVLWTQTIEALIPRPRAGHTSDIDFPGLIEELEMSGFIWETHCDRRGRIVSYQLSDLATGLELPGLADCDPALPAVTPRETARRPR